MSNTEKLQLPYIMAAQAQKHITHNEALRKLDAVVQLAVLDRNLSTPPVSPENGDRYLIDVNATGDWLGHDREIAAFQDNAWMFYSANEGWLCWVADENILLAYDGTLWSKVSGSGENTPKFGINTIADNTNRLSVKSDATLFSHDDITPGSGDIRATLNKSAVDKTASFVFQTNWSGRAEIGLAGDDNFHLKVSADGTIWNEALIIDAQSGAARLPRNAMTENLIFNLFKDAGRFAGTPEPVGTSVGAFVAPNYLSTYNGGTFSGHAKFIYNNSTHGGSSGALDVQVDALISKLQVTTSSRRYGPEFWVMRVIAGTGTTGLRTVNNINRYLLWVNRGAPFWPKSTWGLNINAESGSLSIDFAPASYDLYIDGVEQTTSAVINPVDGWKQVVFVGTTNPQEFLGSEGSMFKVRAEPSSIVHLALPFLIPAQVRPKTSALFGRVGSLEAWR